MQSISTASTTIAVVASIVAATIRFPVSLVGALGLMLGPFDLGNPCFVYQLTPTTKPSGLVSPLSLSLFVCQYQSLCSHMSHVLAFKLTLCSLFPCLSCTQ
ncbi:hypothetical protein DER44DRAFT_786499 [Fusarium oxysporum]|nr:hypothetical protein DER44DRAFT_786499 [Fusarium oxysporum]